MMIEDNSSDVFLLRRALRAMRGEDFELEIAADGEQAMQLLHGGNGDRALRPCVILLDLHLPKQDGLEILRAIRKNADLRHIQVVVSTNAASPAELEELRQMRIVCRMKPKDLAEVQQLAADLIAACNGSRIAA
jgi:CheY-like chemotaxis protein